MINLTHEGIRASYEKLFGKSDELEEVIESFLVTDSLATAADFLIELLQKIPKKDYKAPEVMEEVYRGLGIYQ